MIKHFFVILAVVASSSAHAKVYSTCQSLYSSGEVVKIECKCGSGTVNAGTIVKVGQVASTACGGAVAH